MKIKILLPVVALLLTGCKTSHNSILTQQPQSDKSIVILYENDVHCGIEGYAKMAGLRDAVRDTAWAALVSSGDYLQGGTAGAISNGQYIADIMKEMHYDAVTLGNHEFDYKIPRMMELIDFAQLPVTNANLYEQPSNKRVFAPFIMKQYGNRKVAFIGVTTPSAYYTEEYAFIEADGSVHYNLREGDIYQLVQEATDEARKAGADYVIVLSHLGEEENVQNCDSHGLVANTRGIDAVLDGHTHSVVECSYVANKDGKLIPVSETGTKFANVGKLVIDKKGGISTQLIPFSAISSINDRVKTVTDSINAVMAEKVQRVVCKSDYVLEILDAEGRQAVRYCETNAGDLVTDAFRELTGSDIAITNGGGIRTSLKAGDLNYGDIVALLPYDNYLCVIDITGAQIVDLLEACCQFAPVENGDFPQVSGIKFTLDLASKPRISDVKVMNKAGEYEAIIMDKKYSLATIDYCITGGGLQGKLKTYPITKDKIMLYSDALVKYVTENLNGVIPARYSAPQGRIITKK